MPCSSAPFSYNTQYYNNQCFSCTDECGGKTKDSKCVVYSGPNLSCSGIETNDSVQTALQKLDEQVCAITGNYSNYQFNCLQTWFGEDITTEAEFVDAITAYACEIAENLSTFTDTTFTTYQTTVSNRFEDIESPAITCSVAGIVDTDDLQTVFGKFCTLFDTIDSSIDLSGVTWDNCFAVVTPPTTVAEGFSLLADQICQLYGSSVALPTFNNTGTCLSGGGANDSLSTTIGLIKTRLCQTPTWDSDNITWGCVTAPSDDGDIEEAIQNIVTVLDSHIQNAPTFDPGDFTVTANDPEDPCAGVTISLTTPINQDRFVAVSAGDASPGTLFTKIDSAGSISVSNNADTTVRLDIATGDKGDITVSGGGNTWTIDNDVVTFAKMQNLTGAALVGKPTGGSGDAQEITLGTGLEFSGSALQVQGRTLLGITKFTATGTWNKPTGCTAALIYVIGGGGGGGGVSSNAAEAAVAGGGGAGALAIHFATSGLGSTENVTIGAGGAGGANSGADGGNGGTSSFGAHASAEGGYGGKYMTSGTTAQIAAGGASGVTASGNLLTAAGEVGRHAIRLGVTASEIVSGNGGNSLFGAYGGTNKGAGGTGAGAVNGATGTGTSGEDGIVIVFEYS